MHSNLGEQTNWEIGFFFSKHWLKEKRKEKSAPLHSVSNRQWKASVYLSAAYHISHKGYNKIICFSFEWQSVSTLVKRIMLQNHKPLCFCTFQTCSCSPDIHFFPFTNNQECTFSMGNNLVILLTWEGIISGCQPQCGDLWNNQRATEGRDLFHNLLKCMRKDKHSTPLILFM